MADWLKARLKESSTWRGLGLLLVSVGLLPMGSVDVLVSAGIAIAGVVEAARAEK